MDKLDPGESDRNLWLQNRILWTAVVAFAFLIAAVLLGDNEATVPKRIGTVSRDIALALLIAIGVAISIEAAARRELERTIRKELTDQLAKLNTMTKLLESTVENSSAVLFQRLPKEIRDEIDASILRSDFVRFGYHATYDLTVINARDLSQDAADISVMKLQVTTEYKVQNVAHQPRDFPIFLRIDNPVEPVFQQFTKILSVNVEDVELVDETRIEKQTGTHVEFKYTRTNIPQGGSVSVRSVFSMIKSLSDYEVWQSMYPSDRIDMTLNFPPEVKEWDAFEMHRSVLRVWPREKHRGQLHMEQAVLPSQGLTFFWRC